MFTLQFCQDGLSATKLPVWPRYVKSQATATHRSPWEWGVLWVAGQPGSNEAPEEQGSPVPLLNCQKVSSIPGVVNTEKPTDASHLGLCIQRIMVLLFSFLEENSKSSFAFFILYLRKLRCRLDKETWLSFNRIGATFFLVILIMKIIRNFYLALLLITFCARDYLVLKMTPWAQFLLFNPML